MNRHLLAILLGLSLPAGLSGQYSQADVDKLGLIAPEASTAPRGGPCTGDPLDLLYPLDGTYRLVDFFGDGCTGAGCATSPNQLNDDDSATLPLPFLFSFYGDLRSDCFVNNNGNLSFGEYFATFTAEGFPVADFPMIAPFWGDVDTRSQSNPSANVWQKFFDSDTDGDLDTLVVTWDNVGYYFEHGDLRNTFQVAISDGSNPLMGLNNNVCFSYDEMCWTTGDASQGIGGFGGVPATVGANRGNGVDFFQIGRYDHPGVDFDGPVGNSDGVDHLDRQTFCFSTSGDTSNIPPIPIDFPQNLEVTLNVDLNQSLDMSVGFLSPENFQATAVRVIDIDGAVAQGLRVLNTPGNVANLRFVWTPDCGDVGDYLVNLVAIDSFNPPGVTETRLTIHVLCGACDSPAISVQPLSQVVCENGAVSLSITAGGTGPLSYQWRKDGLGLPGQTATTLILNPAQTTDFGSYDILISNRCGSVISDAAIVVVWPLGSADVNGSGTVDGADVEAFMTVVRTSPNGPPALDFCGADMNGDGRVNFADVPALVAAILNSQP